MSDWLSQLLAECRTKKEIPGLDGKHSIVIYGTGSMAQDVRRVLCDHGFSVIGFVDHMEGRPISLNGLPVSRPEEFRGLPKTESRPAVVLGIHNYQADIPAIVDRLEANGLTSIIPPVDLYDTYAEDLGPRYWLTSRGWYLSMETKIRTALDLWSDRDSKGLFRAMLEYRIRGDASLLPAHDPENQYHPLGIPPWRTPLRLIDCGAFDGDTLEGFLRSSIPLERIAAFEPDTDSFSRLTHFVDTHESELPDVQLWPCGVFSQTNKFLFDAGHGLSSNISPTGTSVVQCVALDDVLPTFAPNLIKMDIEGSEYDALVGACRMIKRYLPGLAISLYHRPEHLWQIPLWVEQITPRKYDMFLRSHARNDFELVFYAIPNRRE